MSQHRLSFFESQRRLGHVHAQPGQVERLGLWYIGWPSRIPRPTESLQWSSLRIAWQHQPFNVIILPNLLPYFILPTAKVTVHRQVLSPCDAGHVRIWSWAAFKNVMCVDVFWTLRCITHTLAFTSVFWVISVLDWWVVLIHLHILFFYRPGQHNQMSNSLYCGCKNWTHVSPSPLMRGSLHVAIVSVFHSFLMKKVKCQLEICLQYYQVFGRFDSYLLRW